MLGSRSALIGKRGAGASFDGSDDSSASSSESPGNRSKDDRFYLMLDNVSFLDSIDLSDVVNLPAAKANVSSPGKLRFDSLDVLGRRKERKILSRALKRVHSEADEGGKELVLVHGLSGCGKTCLVQTLRDRVRQLKGLYTFGKFDLYQRDEPYSALAAACRQICGKLYALGKRSNEKFLVIQNLIHERLADDIPLLSTILPELLEIVGDAFLPVASPQDQNQNQDNMDTERTKLRLHLAFRGFLRLIVEHMSPLVLVLDDVQWADTASLELLNFLAADVENKKTLFICIYRSNDVGHDHPFSKVVEGLRKDVETNGLKITEIEVGNLTLQSVNEILMQLLNYENPESTFELAELCHRRTLGNVFFVLAFIRSLRDGRLLKFDVAHTQWKWDVDAILDNTAAAKNVVELMKLEIERVPASVGKRLSFAAFLGQSFKPLVLDMLWQDLKVETESDESEGVLWLSIAVDCGFIEPANQAKTSYQWIHDTVREAAAEIVPHGTIVKHKAALGQSLIKRLSDEDLESMIFVVSNLAHEGMLYDNADRARNIEFANLNLRSALKATRISAFDSAAKYAERGIGVLPEDRWLAFYELTLKLYTVAAESFLSIGKVDLVKKYCQEVIAQTDRPLVDKLPLYTAMIYTGQSSSLDIHSDASIEFCLNVLRELNVNFPTRKATCMVRVLLGIRLWKKRAKTMTTEYFAEQPAMIDPTDQYIMRLLNLLVHLSFRSGKHKLFVLLGTFEMLRMTTELGISDFSPTALSLLTVVLTGLGDFKLGFKISNIAVDMLDRSSSKSAEANSLLSVVTFGKPWVERIRDSMIGLLTRGYKSGLSCGDIDFALMCMSQVVVADFQTGQNLFQIESDCRNYGNQALAFKRKVSLNCFKMYWLVAVKLMGNPESLRPFAGIDPSTSMYDIPMHLDSEKIDLAICEGLKSILHCVMGEHERGAALAMKNSKSYAKLMPGHFAVTHVTFSCCLSLYAMARKSKRRKFRRKAAKLHKIIKKWRNDGNPNVIHYDFILDAERASLRGEFDAAEGLFENAKILATRHGLLNDSALISERYGEFALTKRNDEAEASSLFQDAIRLYGELGANTKVEQLRLQHSSSLWPEPSEVVIQSSGRVRVHMYYND